MKKIFTAKKFLQLFLIMLVCAATFSVNTQAKSQKQKAMAAYKTMLSKKKYVYTSGSGGKLYRYFATAYIDNDNIPELVLFDELVNGGEGATLYTYKNGKVKSLGKIDFYDAYEGSVHKFNKSKVGYIQKGNVIRDFYYDDLVTEFVDYLKISKGKLVMQSYYELIPIKGDDAEETADILNDFFDSNHFTNYKKVAKLPSKIYAKRVKKTDDGFVFKKISQSEYNKGVKKLTKSKKFKRFSMHKNTASNRKKYLK